ncbi:MAG TPA: alpha/beta fold hydrolase [Solirubrobacteraceae bacterium]|nr:alpha/beta fold hydrolase [Solirubrobacteraceae bacterium]
MSAPVQAKRLSLRMRAPDDAPAPPVPMPPGFIVGVPDRGEFMVRDSGGDGPLLLLLHGWVVSADVNFYGQYDALRWAGYRVLALDHRGHGRGLRTPAPFRLADCAADAAAVLRELGTGPALAVGYSMGGPIASLLARDFPDQVSGLVLCATSADWTEPRQRRTWRAMGAVRLGLGLFPNAAWRAGLRSVGLPDTAVTTWLASELSRGSARDLAEAGRELGRYDGRPWLPSLGVPAAVVVTADDSDVPPRKQRELAALLGAPTFEVDGDHLVAGTAPEHFNPYLLRALERVRAAHATAV